MKQMASRRWLPLLEASNTPLRTWLTSLAAVAAFYAISWTIVLFSWNAVLTSAAGIAVRELAGNVQKVNSHVPTKLRGCDWLGWPTTALGALCLAFVLAACTSERAQPGPSNNEVAAASSSIAKIILTLGGADGFDGAPMASVMMPDGSIVAVDSKLLRLSIYDTVGVLQASTGQRGEGPGSFLEISDVFPATSTTFAAFDPLAQRISVFAFDGQLLRSERIVAWSNYQPLRIIAELEDGRYVGLHSRRVPRSSEQGGVFRDSVELVVGRLNEAPRRLFALDAALAISVNDAGSQREIPVPAASPRALSICRNSVIVVRDSVRDEYNWSGQLLSRSALGMRGRSLGDDWITSSSDRTSAFLRSPSTRALANAKLRNVLRDHSYASGFVLIDQSGALWFRTPGGSSEFSRIAGSHTTGTVRQPMPHFWLQATRDRILAIRPESDSSGAVLDILQVTSDASDRSVTMPLGSCGRTIRF